MIDDLFKNKSTIIEIEDSIYKKAGEYALEKKAPFKQKNSYADALILFSFLEFVKSNSIENSMFISYNTDDFCEKKDGKKTLHPDLKNEFLTAKSNYYKIVGEALNTIEKDIVSKEELALIEELQNENKWTDEIEYCGICEENHDRNNVVNFHSIDLFDERKPEVVDNPEQTELGFAKGLPKSRLKGQYSSIEVGNCEWCNSEHFKCIECDHLNFIWDNEFNKPKECEGCGLEYIVCKRYDTDGIEEIEYMIPKTTETCEKCSNEFDLEDMIENLCYECENQYSYGE